MDLDFATFKEIAKCLPKDVSVCMRGRHGIGKTEMVRQLGQEWELPVIERRLSQVSEGDLIGMPDQNDHVTTKFLPPDWFKEAMDFPRLIFLDEFDRADLPVKQAAMELILDRRIQGKEIHKDCRIYAAINGGKHGSNYHVQDLDIAINDRFWIGDIEPTVKDWLKWAEDNIIDDIYDFIAENDEYLELKKMPDEAHEITPSRRSWTRLSDTIAANEHLLESDKIKTKMFKMLCTGFVGPTAASNFVRFLANKDKVKVSDILDNYPKKKEVISNLKIDQVNVLIDKLHKHSANPDRPQWTKRQVQNIARFFESLKPETKVNMWDKLTQADCKLANAQKIAEAISDDIVDLLSN